MLTAVRTVESPAKINLSLDILGRDTRRGYHFVETVMTVVPDLCDEVDLYPLASEDLQITCDWPALPLGPNNTCWRAAALLTGGKRPKRGARLHLRKRIPPGSGLGGGSSNAAAALLLLNDFWEMGHSRESLAALAAQIGMDAPFFLSGGTAYCSGFGERITALPALSGLNIRLLFSPTPVATRQAYAAVDLRQVGKNREQSRQLKEAVQSRNTEAIFSLMHNDFELMTEQKNLIEHNKKTLLAQGARAALMTGSGAAVYGLFTS